MERIDPIGERPRVVPSIPPVHRRRDDEERERRREERRRPPERDSEAPTGPDADGHIDVRA